MNQLDLFQDPPRGAQPRTPWKFTNQHLVTVEQEVERCPHCGEALRIRERLTTHYRQRSEAMPWNNILKFTSFVDHLKECENAPKRWRRRPE